MVAQSGVLPENRCAKLRPPLEFYLVAAPVLAVMCPTATGGMEGNT